MCYTLIIYNLHLSTQRRLDLHLPWGWSRYEWLHVLHPSSPISHVPGGPVVDAGAADDDAPVHRDGGDREGGDHHEDGLQRAQYSTVQYSTAQYSTVPGARRAAPSWAATRRTGPARARPPPRPRAPGSTCPAQAPS